MKTNKLLYILAGALLSLCVLASCGTSASSDQETTTETDTGAEIATGATTSAETTAETKEEVTQMPRYDYFEAEVGPDVTLDKSVYASMKLELPKSLLVTDEQVQTYLNYLIFQEREAVNGDTKVYDQPLKLGDTAYIYYRGTVDGKEFEGGSNMEDKTSYGLGLGSGSFIPGFEEGLVGVIPNQTSKDNPAEVHVTFPEGYSAELGGKDAIFYVYVEYAVQYTLPEYTREFVEKTLKYESEKVHVTEKSFLAEFEAYLKTYIEDQNKENVEAAKTDALWTYLTEKVVCVNLPQMELDYYTTSYLNEINAAYEYYSTGASKDQFLEMYPTVGDFAIVFMGYDEDADWEAEIAKQAELMVKKDMLVHAIAEWENMETVTDEELEDEIEYWIEYYGGYVTKEDILENIGEAYLRESAFAVKMYDYLIANCTFEYTK
ncbi:MAG: FKBP-type peptidyl-prolyl cis-trans isomerase [Clostridia bacterium]|nr:FKBP-type peptidyl-prolyl cis-trans isomerase [Clostridia bacterium]